MSSAATQIGVGPKRPARSFRGSGPSPGADQRSATSATAGSMGGISFKCPIGHQVDISLENWTATFSLRVHSRNSQVRVHSMIGPDLKSACETPWFRHIIAFRQVTRVFRSHTPHLTQLHCTTGQSITGAGRSSKPQRWRFCLLADASDGYPGVHDRVRGSSHVRKRRHHELVSRLLEDRANDPR